MTAEILAEFQTLFEIAPTPSIYLLWGDSVEATGFLQVCRESAFPVLRLRATNEFWIQSLPGLDFGDTNTRGFVIEGGLSSIAQSLRPTINGIRERFLTFSRPVFLSESIEFEKQLREDFPDLFAVIRQEFYLETSITSGEEACSSIAGGSLDRLVRQLPDPHVKGSLIYSQGKVHFKGAAVDRCPRCGKTPKWLPTTLTFRHAPVATQVQTTQGWVCECGEKYVPGMLAKEAHQRAFQSPTT